MKIRQTIKKVAALGIGATMLGATLMGAVAADLSDYPSPFVQNGQFNGQIVIGEKAATQDVLGAIDIAASLQAASTTTTSVSCSGTGVSVTNGVTEKIVLGNDLKSGWTTALDDNDIPTLLDSKIAWADEELDVNEEISVVDDAISVVTSGANGDEDMGKDVFLSTSTRGALTYTLTVGGSNFNTGLVSDGGGADFDTVKVDFLGKPIEIVEVGTDYVKVVSANEYYMAVGETVEVEGKTVKLENVGSSDNIVMSVDGTRKTISDFNVERLGGLKVQIVNTFYVDDMTQRSATIKLGESITTRVENNDPMEMFGEPDTANDAEWLWTLQTMSVNDTQIVLGAKHNQKWSKFDDAKKVGEAITFPNGFATVELTSLTTEATNKIEINPVNDQGIDVNSTEGSVTFDDEFSGFVLTADDDLFMVKVGGNFNEETDTVYLLINESKTCTADTANNLFVAFKNKDGDVQLSQVVIDENATSLGFQIINDETAFNATVSGACVSDIDFMGVSGTDPYTVAAATGSLNVSLNYTAALTSAGNDDPFFGTDTDEDSTDELIANGVVIDSKEKDYRTTYGWYVATPEGNLDDNTVVIYLPTEQVEANVVIKGKDGAVAGGSSGSGKSVMINPISVGIAVLDKDASTGVNQIVVGGPCANTVAASLLEVTDNAECAKDFSEGKGMIRLFSKTGGKVAILVAGWDAVDTQNAATVLADYEDYDLTGTEKVVTATTLKNLN